MIVIDVGANSGEFAQDLLRRHSNVQVYAVEPNAHDFEICLSKIMVLFPGRFNVDYFALDTKSYTGQFHNVGHNSGQLGSLKEINKDSPGWQGFDRSQLSSGGTLRVEVRTPSEFMTLNGLTHVDFLKIDIQGNDVEVLEDFLSHHSVRSGVVEVDCGFIEGSQRYFGAADNEINRLVKILSKHNMKICRITPNNSHVDELNVFFATDVESWHEISLALDLARSPSFARYWTVQGLGLSTDEELTTLLRNVIKKIGLSFLHPGQSIRSVLLKLSK